MTASKLYDPRKLVLITKKDHPLYDPRVELPMDMEMFYDMLRNGWELGAIEVVDVDGFMGVVIGQGRTACAQLACNVLEDPENEAHKAHLQAAFPEGVPDPLPKPFKVEVKPRDSGESSAQTYHAKIVENNLRRATPPLLQAKQMLHYEQLRLEELGDKATKSQKRALTAEMANLFRCDVDTVRRRLMVVKKATKETKALLDAGKITWSQAVDSIAASDSPEEQDKKVKGKPQKDPSKAAKRTRTGSRITYKQLEKIAEAAGDGHKWAVVFQAILGSPKASRKLFFEVLKLDPKEFGL